MKRLFENRNGISGPLLIGHRGFTPLAPENSLPSFECAGRLGLWAIETDVRRTRDGVLVCCHDEKTLAMFGEALPIAESRFDELRKLRFTRGNGLDRWPPERLVMPAFGEYLDICVKHGAVPFIETKQEVVAEVLAELRKRGLERRAVLSSCDFRHLREARRLSRSLFIHHIFSDGETMLDLAGLGNSGLSYDISDPDRVPEGLIEGTHAHGVRVCLRAGDARSAVAKMTALPLDYIPTNCMAPC